MFTAVAHEVPSASLIEEFDVFLADHTPIQNPDPFRSPVTTFHGLHNLLKRLAVVAVAFEDVIRDRQPLARDHQPDTNLFAVGAMITGVSPAGLWIPRGFTFKVRGCHVVQEQFIAGVEQGGEAFLQVRFDRLLMWQNRIVRAVESLRIDQAVRYAE